MQAIQEAKLALVKYDQRWPVLPRVKLFRVRTKSPRPDGITPESLARLNEKAKGYPFCIMYHTKKNDPL